MMDVSAVRADSTREEIREAAQLAKQYGCVGVFALPAHTQYLIDLLSGSPVFAGGVVGFPGGGETTACKAATADELVGMGCREIDMVNNIAWLKAGEAGAYTRDVRAVVEAAGGKTDHPARKHGAARQKIDQILRVRGQGEHADAAVLLRQLRRLPDLLPRAVGPHRADIHHPRNFPYRHRHVYPPSITRSEPVM
jgi:hypothetical protein